jgi:hypothetical protein
MDETLSQSRDEDLLPQWSTLTANVQAQIVEAAERYLEQECPVRNTAWSRRGELPGRVLFGFWALRLLGAGAPERFISLPETIWREWMPCVFGDPYSEDVVDARHETVLKAADRIARNRFLAVLSELIEGQNQWSGTVHILDRLVPVWSSEAAELLRSKLCAAEIKPMCFRQILNLLLERGDQSASQIAAGCLCNIHSEPDADVRRPVGAAMELLSRNPVPAWDAAWRVAEANETFAQELLAALEREVLSQNGGRMLEGLREDQLADAYIWLAHHGVTSREARQFGVVTDGNNLDWLGMSVMNHLVNRGTAEAYRQIGRIKSAAPGEPLQFASNEAAELVRRNTWAPLTPAQVIELGRDIGRLPETRGAPGTEVWPSKSGGLVEVASTEPGPTPGNASDRSPAVAQTLEVVLEEAEARTADPGLRKKLCTVLRYEHYLRELQSLKKTCKRYQTAELLKREFRHLDVWAILDDSECKEIPAGEFKPNVYAWSLVKRLNGLQGSGNRTLKQYRCDLRVAGLLPSR